MGTGQLVTGNAGNNSGGGGGLAASPLIDVAQFGVLPSLTDNSGPMTTALAYAAGTGQGLWFPKGTYNFNSNATWTSSVPLYSIEGSAVSFTGEGAPSVSTQVLVLGAAPGSSAYNPNWYALTQIYWDPVNGNDTNSGAGSGNAVKTFAEIVRRFGGVEPEFNYGQTVTIHLLSAQSAGTDPVFFEPKISGGGQAILDCRSAWTTAGTNFTAGALSGGFGYSGATPSAGGSPLTVASVPGYVVQGILLFNSTRTSYAFVDAVSGGNATLTQPHTASSLTTTTALPSPTVDNDWVAGDTITPYVTPHVNLKSWSPIGGDLSTGNVPCAGWVLGANLVDTSGTGASSYGMLNQSANNVFSLCKIDPRFYISNEIVRGFGVYILGCYLGQVVDVMGGEIEIAGGTLRGGIAGFGAETILANNVLAHGSISVGTGSFFAVSGGMYFDGSISITSAFFERNSGVVWGSGTVTVGIAGSYLDGSFTADLLTTGALKLGGSTTGTSYSAGVWLDGVNITPANLDSNNGLQSPRLGARYTTGS